MVTSKIKLKFDNYSLIACALLVVVIILTYFLPLSQATTYRDDWYYVVDRMKGGPQTYHAMFTIDRPFRGYFFELYYGIFGTNPAPYHLASMVLRLAAGLAAFWLLRLLWPEHREAVLVMSVLFVLYPGYTHWMEGFENQPSMFSLFLAVISIFLTLKALGASHPLARVTLWSTSIITGLIYLALVEYAIGTEFFRFLCVYAWINRNRQGFSLSQKALAALRAWIPAALIPAIFLLWRLFVFSNQRPETDVGLQLGAFVNSPITTGFTWIINLFRSVINQAILAWWSPHFQDIFAWRNREIFISMVLAGGVAICVVAAMLWVQRHWRRATALKGVISIGSLGVVAGVLPVVAVNRVVTLDAYSHYALPASLASAVLLGSVVCMITSPRLRTGLVILLVLLAFVNHNVISAKVLEEEASIASFWEQVTWRAPGIHPGTALTISYPSVNYGEDVDAVNGPANFIYFPEPYGSLPVYYPLYAVKQSDWTAKQLLSEMVIEVGYRTHFGSIDPASMLVISQPTQDACVHILDSRYPWYSYNDADFILLAGRYSKIEQVLTDTSSPLMDTAIFRVQFERDWCYYFEQAELAVQQQDWEAVSALGDEAIAQSMHPVERLEWMPFLQAYAMLRDEAAFAQVASRIASMESGDMFSIGEASLIGEYNRRQACNVLESMQEIGLVFSPHIQARIDESLCW